MALDMKESVLKVVRDDRPFLTAYRLIKNRQQGLSSFGSADHLELLLRSSVVLNRPGFAGGSNFQIGWSHDEQNDEQVFP